MFTSVKAEPVYVLHRVLVRGTRHKTRLATRTRTAFTHLHEMIEEVHEDGQVRFDVFGQLVEPALCKGFQPDVARLQVDHTTATDRGRRGHRQVRHLEHHRHWLGGGHRRKSSVENRVRMVRSNQRVCLVRSSQSINDPMARYGLNLRSAGWRFVRMESNWHKLGVGGCGVREGSPLCFCIIFEVLLL